MAFDSLSSRLQMAMRRLTGKGKLTETDIDEMMREVRLSLLEADVNLKVIKTFINNVKEKAVGQKILSGLNPGQQVVKIVFDELKRVMGDESVGISYKINGLTVIMTVGLQGSGK
ncbi:MAG: signal recognition particle receptor subunit alpha, partial [Acholeplasmataceae bacterium]